MAERAYRVRVALAGCIESPAAPRFAVGRFIPSLAVVGLAVVALGPAAFAGWTLIDDHSVFAEWRPPLVDGADAATGRFRPGHTLLWIGLQAVLGTSPVAWRLASIGCGLASAWLLWAVLRRSGVGVGPSLLAAATVLVLPGASSAWLRVGLQETLGVPLLLLAAYAARRAGRWDAVALVAALLAALVKEPLALAVPALAAWRLYVGGPHARRVGLALLGVGGLAIGGIAAVAGSAGAGTEGGAYLAIASAGRFAGLGWALLTLGLLGGALAFVGLPALRHARAWPILAVLVLLVGPQLLLYARAGFVSGRYSLPAALAVPVSLALTLDWLARCGPHRARSFAAAWLLLLVVQASITRGEALALVRIGDRVAEATARIEREPLGARVGVVAANVEPAVAFRTLLARDGRADLAIVDGCEDVSLLVAVNGAPGLPPCAAPVLDSRDVPLTIR